MKSVRLTVGEVRFCYVHVAEPWAPEGTSEKPKYCITLLIPKSNGELVQSIVNGLNEAYENTVIEKWNGNRPQQGYWHNPLRDGDSPKMDGTPRGDEFKGHWFINCKSAVKPGVIGPDKQPLQNIDEDLYPGCFGYASISFAGYQFGRSCGISCFINNIMKTMNGENLRDVYDKDGSGKPRGKKKDDFANVNPVVSPTDDFGGVQLQNNQTIVQPQIQVNTSPVGNLQSVLGSVQNTPNVQPNTQPDLANMSKEQMMLMLQQMMSQQK